MATFASQISFVLLFVLLATTFNRSLGTSKGVIRCNENDERLLSIFKEGVVDPNNQLSSWNVEHDCCSWEGVQCDNFTARVTQLSLSNYALRGEINLCLLQLEFLTHLDLSFNHFETVSKSPSQISKPAFGNQSLATHYASFSASLRHLDFSQNYGLRLKDDIHWLSQLSSLKYLDLSLIDIGNETKLLQHISVLPSLSELRLNDCGLRDFPSIDYLNFTSLEVLDLSDNFYMMKSKFPDSFFNITNHIHHLDLHLCSFYGQLPKALLNLQNLKYLDLSYNDLQGSIPDWFGQYEHMQYLDIQYNLFNGVIPSSFGNISSMSNLDLSNNQLIGNLPETLGQLHNLNQLHIGHNSLVGVLTEKNFSNFSNLTSLDLSSTSFEFDIDPKWIPPFQLEDLNLGNTSLGPNVPTWLYLQHSLTYLDISSSGISKIDVYVFWSFIGGIDGHVDISNNMISDDISNVTLSPNISYFDASHNSLSGSVSSLLCQLESNEESELYYLDLSYNHLSGALPDCWANLKQLNYINLRSNKLTGGVPPSLDLLFNLILLDLSDNSFLGEFSLGMTNLTKLEYLLLEKNNFSGSLPTHVPQNLLLIKLRINKFIGNIPSQWCNLSYLTVIDLAGNKLSGSIPHCLSKIMRPNYVTILPTEIVTIFTKGRELDYPSYRLPILKSGIIDLSANSFSGEIPIDLLINRTHSLDLSRNHLTGKIPKEIGRMENLESLDLSYNKLSGEIPSTISNLSFLAYLNLSYNNFTGQIPMGTQIQSFDSWSFVGNPELCGDPLPNKCNKDDSKLSEENEDDNFLKSLYLGMGVGFAVGFWGVCGSLFLVRAWRHKFFQWFDHLVDRLYVAFAQCFKSLS